MRRLFFICVALSLLLQAFSCSLNNDGPNFHFKPLQITNAELPDSFELKETYQITVNYTIPDSCTDFSGFDVTHKVIPRLEMLWFLELYVLTKKLVQLRPRKLRRRLVSSAYMMNPILFVFGKEKEKMENRSILRLWFLLTRSNNN